MFIIRCDKTQLKIGDKIFVPSYKLPKSIIAIRYNGVIVKFGKNTIHCNFKQYQKVVNNLSDITG